VTRALVLATVAATVASVAAGAQVCEPRTDSNEAKIFGNRSLALAAGRAGAVDVATPYSVRLEVEAVMLPGVSDETATPTTCRPGKGPENVNVLPALARVRISVSLPAGLSLEASWLPPVRLAGVTGNVAAAALGYSRPLTNGLAAGLRVHATFGTVTGPFTCDDDDLEDAASECFGGTRSEDRFRPNIVGADLALGPRRDSRDVAWYAGAGYSRLAPRFQVHFRNAAGDLDRTRVEVDLHRVAAFGGITWTFAPAWSGSAEVYGTTADGATVRVALDRTIRRGR
jgi:hypothetical protein